MNLRNRMAWCWIVLLLAAQFGPSASGADTIELEKFLPAEGEIPGWAPDGIPLFYDEASLWEYIDGSAENYLAYNFKQVVVQDYLLVPDRELKVEIYMFESPLMAFGIYSQYRHPELTFYEIGNEAFGDDYSINFWKGSYYVRVSVYDESEEGLTDMETFARAVASKIEETGSLPPEINSFPEKGLVVNGTRYLTQGVLGLSKFPPAFVASYMFGKDEGRLYLSTLSDSAAARAAFDWYASQVKASPGIDRASGHAFVKALGNDKYQGDVIVFQYGRWLGVLTGFKASRIQRDALMEEEVGNLASLAPGPAGK
jgi:Family of unknown function (DUF6599)